MFKYQPGVMVQVCNTSTWEDEAGKLSWFQGQSQQHGETV